MKKRLFIDPTLCTGCRICEVTCSIAKEGEVNPYKSRIRVVNTKYFNIAVTCRLCEHPPCVQICPANALSQDKDTGIILVDEKLCIGCYRCVEECPFGAINRHPKGTVVICDLCKGEPKCAKRCPNKAIEYLSVDSLAYQKRRNAVIKMLHEVL